MSKNSSVNLLLVFYYTLAVLIQVFTNILAEKVKLKSYSVYKTPENIISNGYPAERHHVTTEDGYILEIHRIPHGKANNISTFQKPVVFLMHGFLGASNYFIALGPKNGLAYNYADAGFDVWMGNARGTRISRRHVTLDPNNAKDKLKFFNFSYEEIGTYDVPACVDYILNKTKEKQLHYVGHSQGGTVFLVLGSMRPEYNKKFKSVHLMAPAGYQDYVSESTKDVLSHYTDIIYNIALSFSLVELFPYAIKLPKSLCEYGPKTKFLCDLFSLKIVVGAVKNRKTDNFEIGGGSLKQLAHFGQNFRDKEFRRWNFGLRGNKKVYGQKNPPNYAIELITANVTFHYSVADTTVDHRNIKCMAKHMPNANLREVSQEKFDHMDFVTGFGGKNMVTDYIITTLTKLESKRNIKKTSFQYPEGKFFHPQVEVGSAKSITNHTAYNTIFVAYFLLSRFGTYSYLC